MLKHFIDSDIHKLSCFFYRNIIVYRVVQLSAGVAEVELSAGVGEVELVQV